MDSVDQIFNFRQMVNQRHMFHCLTISVFLDKKAAFDSVDCEARWRCLFLRGASQKFIPCNQSLYANSRSPVHAYGDVWPEFIMRSGFRQRCLLSLFFDFFIESVMKIAQSSCENSGIDIFSDSDSPDYWVNIQVGCAFLSIIWASVGFAPRKYNMLSQHLSSSKPNLINAREQLDEVDRFVLFDSSISLFVYQMKFLHAYKRPDRFLLI